MPRAYAMSRTLALSWSGGRARTHAHDPMGPPVAAANDQRVGWTHDTRTARRRRPHRIVQPPGSVTVSPVAEPDNVLQTRASQALYTQ